MTLSGIALLASLVTLPVLGDKSCYINGEPFESIDRYSNDYLDIDGLLCRGGNCQCIDKRIIDKRYGAPQKFQYQKPSSNGCGSAKMRMAMWSFDEHCCDKHDHCYSTKG